MRVCFFPIYLRYMLVVLAGHLFSKALRCISPCLLLHVKIICRNLRRGLFSSVAFVQYHTAFFLISVWQSSDSLHELLIAIVKVILIA